MIWKSVLFRPESLYEALFRQKLLGSGSETVVGTDYTPYIYRSAPDFQTPYNRQRPTVIGGSLGWNQLANPSDYEADKTASGCTFEKQSDGSVKVTVSATIASAVRYRVSDSIYTNGHKYLLTIGGNYGLDHFSLTVGDRAWSSIVVGANGLYSTIWNAVNGDVYVLGINARIGCPSGTYTLKPQIIDLTALFGATVADAIYAMEQSVSGSGVAFFKNLFRDDYFPFNSGELMSVQTSAHRIYDAGAQSMSEYPLSNIVLRGVPKWIDGDLRYDGDRYLPNGTVERRYAEVDLGSLTWISRGNSIFTLAPDSWLLSPNNNFGVMCAKYVQNNVGASQLGDMEVSTYGGYNHRDLMIKNTAYSDATAFKTAMDGVMLVYELRTPTTESATPYTALQMADPQGTEEWVDNRTVKIPVGQITDYIQK